MSQPPQPVPSRHPTGTTRVGDASAARQLTAAAVTVAITCGGYLLWLGWHATKHLVAGTTDYAGPYESWQVAGLVLTLTLVAVVGGWLRLVAATAVTAAVAVTLMFSFDASGQSSEDANLWPVGAVLLLIGSLLGLLAVAVLARAVGRLTARRSS